VHVGAVLPGFIKTEGFPARELLSRRATAWSVSTPERVAEAIEDVAFGGKPERIVPRFYGAAVLVRATAPGVVFRVVGGSGSAFTPSTGSSEET
jgi:short-subunit dehydrogenase